MSGIKELAAVATPKASKPQNGSAKARSEKKRPEVAATPPKGEKATKNTKESKPKKVKVPASIQAATGAALTHTDPRKGSEIITHRAQLAFKATGNSYSISSILRWLGFYCSAGQSGAVRWLRMCGFADTTAACAGQQTSSGRNNPVDSKKRPNGPGRHGSIPKLDESEAKELRKLYELANPASE